MFSNYSLLLEIPAGFAQITITLTIQIVHFPSRFCHPCPHKLQNFTRSTREMGSSSKLTWRSESPLIACHPKHSYVLLNQLFKFQFVWALWTAVLLLSLPKVLKCRKVADLPQPQNHYLCLTIFRKLLKWLLAKIWNTGIFFGTHCSARYNWLHCSQANPNLLRCPEKGSV